MRFPAGFIGKPDPRLWERDGVRPEGLSVRRSPLLWAALCFCGGIWAARLGWVPAVVWLAAVGMLAGLSVAGKGWVGLVPVAGLWVAIGLGCAEIQPGASSQVELRGFADGLSRTVRGRVMRVRALPPQQGEAGALSVDLGVEAVKEVTPEASRMVPVKGGVRVTVVDVGPMTFRCGDVVVAAMQMKVPGRFRDPGAWQYGDYLLEQGIGVHATVRADRLSRSPGPGWGVRCRVYAAQAWASGRMRAFVGSAANRGLPDGARLTEEDAGTLDAMLFGDRVGLNREMRRGFERTGTFHLFVVSGMHLGLIAAGIFWVARRAKMARWAATGVTLPLIGGYAVLTGFGVPVQRALWMASLYLLANLLERRGDSLNPLGAAVLGTLAVSPSALFEASFQMTFLAMVGVLGISLPLCRRMIEPYLKASKNIRDTWRDVRFEPRLAQFRVMLRWFGEELAGLLNGRGKRLPAWIVRGVLGLAEVCVISLVTEAVMSLPMAVWFHRAALLALPVNVMTIPAIAVLVPAAVVTFCASLISPWVAAIPAGVTGLLLHALLWVVGRIGGLRAAEMRVPGPAVLMGGLAVMLLGFACWAIRRRGGWWGWAPVAVLPVVVALVLWPGKTVAVAGVLEVTAIDVGQGDSVLVVGPGGRAMLVDAGGPVGGPGGRSTAGETGFDVGEEVVAPYLWSRRFRRLDVVALTHEHSDHMGGMPAILRSFRPRELWVGLDVPSAAYAALLDEAKAEGTMVRRMRAGDAVAWDGVAVSVLAPEAGYRNAVAPRNDDSLVMRMEFGKASVLLEGDAERPAENRMMANGRVAPVELLKVGHHGSSTSSTEAFLEAAAPRDAVISVGRGNTFGHPRGEVLARLAERGVKVYRTDMVGVSTFLLDKDGGIREVAGASY